MKPGFILCCLFISLSLQGFTAPTDVIFSGRAGTALNKLTLHQDSSFTQPTNYFFKAGQLLEIIGETSELHDDDAQNQKFKWYKVRSFDGKEGWVFGDGIGVAISEKLLEPAVKTFCKKWMAFGTGFEKAVVWMAAIEGYDNFHANNFLNPLYYEGYIVITNERGQSIHIHYAGESTQGKSEIEAMQFQELTGDNSPEMILVRSSQFTDGAGNQRELELYSFQAGTMRKVFTELLNLPLTDGKPSPCPYKYLELDNGTIRVEYLDFNKCTASTLPLKTGVSADSPDQCPEFVTYTYSWDNRQKNYQLLYEESRNAPQGKVTIPGVFLQLAPSATAPRLRSIRPDEQFDVIRQHEEWVTVKGTQQKERYFYVRLRDGIYGYLPAQYARFTQMAQASQLDAYFRSPNSQPNEENFSFYGIRAIRQDSSAFNH